MTVKLIQGDCMEILPTLAAGSVDAVITDPPYPGLKGNLKYKTSGGVAKAKIFTKTMGDEWGASINWVGFAWEVCKCGMFIFCTHHSIEVFRNTLPDGNPQTLCVWYKRNAPPPVQNVPWQYTEFIWMFKKAPGLLWKNLKSFYDIPMVQGGCFATERILNPDGTSAHPTQKPEALMRELLKCTRPGDTILDPFMGSGTTGVACVQTGRNFIGIELDPGYFAIAEKRIAQAQLQPRLFDDEPKRIEAEQAVLL